MGSRSINHGGQGMPGTASTSPQQWANNTQPQAGGMPAGFDPATNNQPINSGGGVGAFNSFPGNFDPATNNQPINAGGGRPPFPMPQSSAVMPSNPNQQQLWQAQPAVLNQMPTMSQPPTAKCPTCGK